ncbi:aromatic ring-hydroxylating oxygenase subunit alpha [Curvivirga sp.]|uniref:aromatic ring-hydroxylating oxygenase subunit alpha n=1 Tax=Curvivirga sp. TaxID=2856848 RepID=UPI003B59DA77
MSAQTNLKDVLQPVEKAKGLPNAHYIDQDVFDEEKQAVLFNNWSGIGYGKDIPAAGDAKPINFLGMPLLMVRDRDGEIGVFQNTCRHRGMILIEEPTKVRGPIRCPYHGWCYGLKGELRTTPHVGGPGNNEHEDIKLDELGLIKIRSYVWHDIVFVNINGDAPDFTVANAALMERWKEFDQPMTHGGPESSVKLQLKANWKLAVENYLESYHLPFVHPGLNSYSRLEDHYNIDESGKYAGQGTLVYQQLEGEGGHKFPDFDDLSDKWDEAGEYIAVYPNVLLGTHRDHFFTILLEPTGLNETTEHIELYYKDEAVKNPEMGTMLATNAIRWKSVLEEDIFVVEGMQRGRKGDLFDGGKFSPAMDGPTHNFHHWVASNLEASRNA